jgi:transcriptional regulator with XRE-family HTH domain
MVIGERLKAIRLQKGMSQGDIEHRSGLVRAYVSRVENGHLTPTLETLEKFGRALNVKVYQLFYEGEKVRRAAVITRSTKRVSKKESRLLTHFRRVLSRVSPADRQLLLRLAVKMEERA